MVDWKNPRMVGGAIVATLGSITFATLCGYLLFTVLSFGYTLGVF